MIQDSNDETNFSHELLLTDTQVLRLSKASENNSSENTKLLKTQRSKVVHFRGFLGPL